MPDPARFAHLDILSAPRWRPSRWGASLASVPQVLLATDADWIRNDVVAAIADDETQVSRVRRGDEVIEAIIQLQPELVILDMQIGNMGGVAACHAIRHEEGAGRLDPVKVMILLDRADDRWLANTARSDAQFEKPIDPFRFSRAVREVLASDTVASNEPLETGHDPADQSTADESPADSGDAETSDDSTALA